MEYRPPCVLQESGIRGSSFNRVVKDQVLGLDRYWNIGQWRFTRQRPLQRRIQYGSCLDSCGYGTEAVSGHDQPNHYLCSPGRISEILDGEKEQGNRPPFEKRITPFAPIQTREYSVGTIHV